MTIRLHILVALTALTMGAASSARAATIGFDASTDYTNNFFQSNITAGSGTLGYASAYAGTTPVNSTYGTGVVSYVTTGSGTAVFVYDTTPDATPNNLFTSATVDLDFSMSAANTSIAVYFGSNSRTGATADTAIFNLNTNGNGDDTLRFFTGGIVGGTSGGNVGTQFGTTTTATGGGWTINTIYHLKLEITYVTGTTANVTFTISDPYTSSGALSSISATATGITVASGGGEIAFRSGALGGATNNTLDNIGITSSAIPEPSTYALLGGAGVLSLALVSRRKPR
ncbi:MAG TPA: PEP-CTERM sorting domain-containing protein [Rariglobus sp.]|nr:PEP-CTERM sorting domain-containing protein [Rariglobus sp.]